MHFRVSIIAVGRLRQNPALHAVFQEYQKRLTLPLVHMEIDERKTPHKVNTLLNEAIPKDGEVIVLDELGLSLPSVDFAKKLDQLSHLHNGHLVFVIGGADGLSEEIKHKSKFMLSFGRQTWPHLLARVMLIEQIYRAQQILNGHPYHRE